MNENQLARKIMTFESPEFSATAMAVSFGEAQEVARYLIMQWEAKHLDGAVIDDGLEYVRKMQP